MMTTTLREILGQHKKLQPEVDGESTDWRAAAERKCAKGLTLQEISLW